MEENQENISKILSVLSHKIRRQILLILQDKGETTFTELMNTLQIDTGKLSFHIRTLQIFIEQTEAGKYRLSRAGEDAVRIIRDVESWAEVTSVTDRTSNQLQLTSFKRRTAAFLIDFSIMLIPTIFILLPIVASTVGSWWVITLNLLFIALFFVFGYSAILEGFRGQTLGKKATTIMATSLNSKKISYEQAIVRNLGKMLLPFDLLLGFTLNDPKFIRYFDKFAGTTVINLRKQPPSQVIPNSKETSKTQPAERSC